jgi:hypothetical protein
LLLSYGTIGNALRGAYQERAEYRTLAALCIVIGSTCFSP